MYIDLYFPPGSQEIQDWFDNANSDNPSREITDWFYSTPVRVQPDPIETPVGVFNPRPDHSMFWHVLVTEEQYNQRIADNKLCIDFSVADKKYKRDDAPRHVFGPNGIPRLPRDKRPTEEE